MIKTYEPLTFTINFPADLLAKANTFRQQQKSPQKAKQVYLNTLAVYAVRFYCDCMGVAVDLSHSDSWNPAMQTLMNIADLAVGNGKLECRPILPEENICDVPLEVREDRTGYVVVEVDIRNKAATLLGFAKISHQGSLHRADLQPLDDLIDILLPADSPSIALTSVKQIPTQLNNWLNGIFEDLWQTPELTFAANYRSIENLASNSSDISGEVSSHRSKPLMVGCHRLILAVKVTQVANTELDILLQVYPGTERILPKGLLLELLDDESNVVMKTKAETADNFRALTFQIGFQEAFSVRISIGDDSVTELFLS